MCRWMSGKASLPSTNSNSMSGWLAPADGVGVGVGSVWALALRASARRARVIREARAIRASAAVGLGRGSLRSEEGVRRDASRRRREEEATGLSPRVDEGRAQASLLEHTTGGGILDIGADWRGELPHKRSSRLSRKAISVVIILLFRNNASANMQNGEIGLGFFAAG